MDSVKKKRGRTRTDTQPMLRSRFLGLAHFVHVPAGEGQQGNLAGLFHSAGNDALMFGTGTRLAAWEDITFISDVFSEKVSFFVIYDECLICTELAEFGPGKETAFAAGLLPFV